MITELYWVSDPSKLQVYERFDGIHTNMKQLCVVKLKPIRDLYSRIYNIFVYTSK